jgi:hypothetical protein
MEIRVYSKDLRFQGVSENQKSITWTRKYFEPGEFEIHTPITPDNVKLYQMTNIVWIQGAVEAGIIEDLKYEETPMINEITVKGRFLESYMDRRIVYPTVNFEGTVEDAMRTLLDELEHPFPYVELGELQGFTDLVAFQCTWKNLLDYEERLARSANLGFRFRPDFTSRKIIFEVYKGLDRTRTQHERSFAEFSDDFDNINSATYNVNDQLEKTIAYVAGEGEGSSRVVVLVGDTTGEGYARRELYVDAKDISSDGLTQAQYEAALLQRGIEKLNENVLSNSLECVAIPMGNFVYKRNYDLGDLVTTKKSNWGIGQDLRITEIQEIYEHGAMQVRPTLGDPLPTTLNMED